MSKKLIFDEIENEGGVFSVLDEPYTSLSFCGKTISPKMLSAIISCSGLKQLFVGGSSITDSEVAELVQLNNLDWLELSDTKVTNKTVMLCMQFPYLKKLYLFGCECDDGCIQYILNMKTLEVVGIQDSKITAEGLDLLKKERPDLEIA